jgi:hypothetical protein
MVYRPCTLILKSKSALVTAFASLLQDNVGVMRDGRVGHVIRGNVVTTALEMVNAGQIQDNAVARMGTMGLPVHSRNALQIAMGLEGHATG